MRIIKSVVIIFAVMAIATGATSAYFTDQDSVEGNQFGTGTLTIVASDEYGGWGHGRPEQQIAAQNIKPGDTINNLFGIRNFGTVPARVSFHLEQTGGDVELWNVMLAEIIKVEDNSVMYNGPLNMMGEIESPTILGGNNLYEMNRFWVRLTLPESVDNSFQGKSAIFNFIANATTQGT